MLNYDDSHKVMEGIHKVGNFLKDAKEWVLDGGWPIVLILVIHTALTSFVVFDEPDAIRQMINEDNIDFNQGVEVTEQVEDRQEETLSIVVKNGDNAVIIGSTHLDKYSEYDDGIKYYEDDTWVVNTKNGDEFYLDGNNSTIVYGYNHEDKAMEIAHKLVGESGSVVKYSDIVSGLDNNGAESNMTAIISEGDNVVLIDLNDSSLIKYSDTQGNNDQEISALDESWAIRVPDGSIIIVHEDNAMFIKGEGSHQKAEVIASNLVKEGGKISAYGMNSVQNESVSLNQDADLDDDGGRSM